MELVIGVIAAYLLGSIPTGYIFGRVLKGVDVRTMGSGNMGATNVFRTIGKAQGIMVLMLDGLKGFLAVTLLPVLLSGMFDYSIETSRINPYIIFGAAAIAGHIWTVFLKFKGGKGVATTAGVMIGLSPVIFIIALVVWVIVFAARRYVSLASITAALSLPVSALIMGRDLYFVLFMLVLAAVGVYSHRSNIKRLLAGEEKRLL